MVFTFRHQVAMCGDGCNDCGALKAAHAGISLSTTEASVAAPFTSLQQDITCVSTLIREGRATLMSSYVSFKYNIAYNFCSLIVVLFIFTVCRSASGVTPASCLFPLWTIFLVQRNCRVVE